MATSSIKTFQDNAGNTIALEVSELLIEVKKTDKYWIASSPHFKTFGYSKKSEELAVKDLSLALDIFFDVHAKKGTLELALFKFGWTKRDNQYQKPKFFNFPKSTNRHTRKLAFA